MRQQGDKSHLEDAWKHNCDGQSAYSLFGGVFAGIGVVLTLKFAFPFWKKVLFLRKISNMDYEENNNPVSMAAEPSAVLYYGSSTKLRESGIIPELSQLDKSDTLWIIRYLQRQLELMRTQEPLKQETDIDPLYGLQYLRSIHNGMPSFDELRATYIQEKYGI